ncbi:NYN domain-containing protein [Allokutzneria sp. A3M-2-11 16]|uniref:NYN domain-containing protein n=1 Tax=Allokutzneria sp. A3M-2-11 16 TaxID=2962043 RepID=UPI0020B840A3|nr:NYN domain-containing protein [Allokutzneria sp. A3M-2-11 16]MCP3799232.1 NYN domain-containing protein [Allokutzneria sp. A3M-2-11 16]
MIDPSAAQRPTRVGVYVDAFNVYYGARAHCGQRTEGWRWLDIGGLATSLINPRLWPNPIIDRIVYCTALRDRPGDPSSLEDQKCYIEALKQHCGDVRVALGKYRPRICTGLLVGRSGDRRRQVITLGSDQVPDWLPVREVTGPEGRPVLLASIQTFEEKGSDVNVASHLLIDVLAGQIDAAMVFSNDSDLSLSLVEARLRVPVATINPHAMPTAGDLRGGAADGVGGHWWRRLRADDFRAHQMPVRVGSHVKPAGW